jgi:prephenate dehydrogenase
MPLDVLTIVGLGFIGGSIALAAKQQRIARRILAWDRDEQSLKDARAAGIIDEPSPTLASAAERANLVVVATPVDAIADCVNELAKYCAPDTPITDTGSVKLPIHQRLNPADARRFVGGHPLAGSEKPGWRHSSANLFDDRLIVLTSGAETNPDHILNVSTFWSALGARVMKMDPGDHDRAVARTSHLPHLVAAALASGLTSRLESFAATGFRDVTRIASGDPDNWTSILMLNREPLLEALDEFQTRLDAWRNVLMSQNHRSAHEYLLEAKRMRDALGS